MHSGRYDYIAQDRVIWGQAAAEVVVEEANRRCAKRLFLIVSASVNRKTPIVKTIAAAVGDERLAGIFDGCREHAPRETILAAAEAIRRSQPDLIVSVGGGSVIDTAKIVLLALSEGISQVEEFDDWRLTVDEQGTRHIPDAGSPPLRQIAVPTTLSGAEYSCLGGSVDSRSHQKHGFYGPKSCPATVILDPAAALHTPQWLWLSTGIRALDHAVESLCAHDLTPLVEACALHALKLLSQSLPQCKRHPGDPAPRLQAMQGAWLASQGILRVSYGASHGIGHSLGAVTGMSHGYTSCIMLPAVLRWNSEEPDNRERQTRIAHQLGRSDGDAAAAVEDLVVTLGLPTRLRNQGVSRDDLDAIAEGAADNFAVRTNPRKITGKTDLMAILDAAY